MIQEKEERREILQFFLDLSILPEMKELALVACALPWNDQRIKINFYCFTTFVHKN
ncbi:MAG: hypothetical protein QXI58_04810 [Candidatus Micrarchaeia archaeon]